jgi:hypothetical protein
MFTFDLCPLQAGPKKVEASADDQHGWARDLEDDGEVVEHPHVRAASEERAADEARRKAAQRGPSTRPEQGRRGPTL